MQKVKI